MKYEKQSETPREKRDATKDKKRIKKAIIIIISVLVALGLLVGLLSLVTEWLEPDPYDYSQSSPFFYDADYNRNILEEELYLRLDRRIYYDRFGYSYEIKSNDPYDSTAAGAFFYDYFQCIINGDYENYPSFFTDECLATEGFKLPEKFTMQGIYNINVKLFKVDDIGENEGEIISEIYEVSYMIFENNGTFRSDILSGETRTLIFELRITNGEVKINAIGYRNDA